MDFHVMVNDESKIFDQFQDALRFIETKMAQWNNFHPQTDLIIHLQKVPNQTDHVQIHVSDEQKLGDFFGGA